MDRCGEELQKTAEAEHGASQACRETNPRRPFAKFDAIGKAKLDLAELQSSIQAASDYFEGQADWEALSELLDSYGLLKMVMGDNEGAMHIASRRMEIQGLSHRERSDCVATYVGICFLSGKYSEVMLVVKNALEHLSVEEPG